MHSHRFLLLLLRYVHCGQNYKYCLIQPSFPIYVIAALFIDSRHTLTGHTISDCRFFSDGIQSLCSYCYRVAPIKNYNQKRASEMDCFIYVRTRLYPESSHTHSCYYYFQKKKRTQSIKNNCINTIYHRHAAKYVWSMNQ